MPIMGEGGRERGGRRERQREGGGKRERGGEENEGERSVRGKR